MESDDKNLVYLEFFSTLIYMPQLVKIVEPKNVLLPAPTLVLTPTPVPAPISTKKRK